MIIEHKARLAAGKEGQEIQGRGVLSIFDEHQIGIGHESKGIASAVTGANCAHYLTESRVDGPRYFDEHADLGAAIEKKSGFIRDGVANGISDGGLMAEDGYPHRSLLDPGR